MKEILKLGGAYGLANVYHQVLMLLVIPIYVSYLSTEDYGISGLIAVTAGFILAITKTTASYGFSRHYFAPGFEEKRGELFFGSVVFSLFQSLIFAIAFYVYSSKLSLLIFDLPDLDIIIKIYAFIILIQPAEELFQDLAKLQKKAKMLSIMHALNITFSVLLTLLLLTVFNMKVMALIWGAFSISFFNFLYLLPNSLKVMKPTIDLELLKPAVKFGAPMVVAVLALYSMKNVDIYIVKSLLDVGAAGQYHFGYKFGALLNFFFVLPLKSIIEPMIYELENTPDKLRKFVRETSTFFYAAAMVLCLGLALYSKEVLYLLASKPDFREAWVIIPVIAFAHVHFGMMDLFGRGIIMAKKTFYFSLVYAIGAAVNIGLNYILIPPYGILGAAYATLAAYLLIGILSAILSNIHYQQKFDVLKIMIITAIGIAFYSISTFFSVNLYLDILIKFLLFFAFIIIYFYYILSKSQKADFITKLKLKK